MWINWTWKVHPHPHHFKFKWLSRCEVMEMHYKCTNILDQICWDVVKMNVKYLLLGWLWISDSGMINDGCANTRSFTTIKLNFAFYKMMALYCSNCLRGSLLVHRKWTTSMPCGKQTHWNQVFFFPSWGECHGHICPHGPTSRPSYKIMDFKYFHFFSNNV